MSEMLGNRYLLALRAAEAIPHFESHLRKHPDDRRTYQKLAICHALAGRLEGAVRWIERALAGREERTLPASHDPHAASRPDDPLWEQLDIEIREHADELGHARSMLGLAGTHLFREPRTARAELEQLLAELDPNDPLRLPIETIERRLEVL